MDGFKVPQTIPQDLLLIQEFVDVPLPSTSGNISKKVTEDDDISSSGSEDDIESSSDEEVAVLTKSAGDEDTKMVNSSEPSDSDSDLSSDSDSEASEKTGKVPVERQPLQDFDEDEDPLPVQSSGNYFTTKNEISDTEVIRPEIDQVGPDEKLEKVGEIMNIVDRVVIVRGLPSHNLNHASERALDSDTLLVFDDRKVFGYIYETFGPTMQPLYQIKFSESFPLDPERVTIGREVFHVPSRSRFVFVSQIKNMKGSDASNIHDEEVGDDELEFFSDDEAEAAHRSRLKRRRGDSRHRSSRSATPNPTMMRDEELEAFMSGDAYDERGPYDVDFGSLAGRSSISSRPTPTAYDDPYADAYNSGEVTEPEARPDNDLPRSNPASFEHERPPRGRRRGSRGQGRGERGHHRGRGARNAGYQQRSPSLLSTPPDQRTRYSQTLHQEEEYSPLYPEQHNPPPMPFQNPHPYYVPQPQNYVQPVGVQPHINPRFASAFGLSMYPPPSPGPAPQGYGGAQNYIHPQGFSQYGTSTNWTDGWRITMQERAADSQPETNH